MSSENFSLNSSVEYLYRYGTKFSERGPFSLSGSCAQTQSGKHEYAYGVCSFCPCSSSFLLPYAYGRSKIHAITILTVAPLSLSKSYPLRMG